eukprot:3536552-Pyramimonas_sp.AAC.1
MAAIRLSCMSAALSAGSLPFFISVCVRGAALNWRQPSSAKKGHTALAPYPSSTATWCGLKADAVSLMMDAFRRRPTCAHAHAQQAHQGYDSASNRSNNST